MFSSKSYHIHKKLIVCVSMYELLLLTSIKGLQKFSIEWIENFSSERTFLWKISLTGENFFDLIVFWKILYRKFHWLWKNFLDQIFCWKFPWLNNFRDQIFCGKFPWLWKNFLDQIFCRKFAWLWKFFLIKYFMENSPDQFFVEMFLIKENFCDWNNFLTMEILTAKIMVHIILKRWRDIFWF